MDTSKIKIHRVPYEDQDAWHDFRWNTGIGASEASIILGVNPYQSLARLYHYRIGNMPRQEYTNDKMFWGSILEEIIADKWQYHDGTEYGYITNHAQGRVIRNCRRVKGFAVNSEFPWLFGSVDRLINIKGGFEMFEDRKPLKTEAILECKNISSMAAAMWALGVPQYFIVQVMTYMIIFETDYCEVCMLQNGNELKVVPIRKDDLLCEQILEATHNFWHHRVLPGREALSIKRSAIMEGNMRTSEEAQELIDTLEPPPDSSEDYAIFLKEKYRVEKDRLMGTPEHYRLAKADELLKQYIGSLTKKRDYIQNQIKAIFVKEQVERIEWGQLGKMDWTKNASGNLVLRTSIKDKPSDSFVDMELSKLKAEY